MIVPVLLVVASLAFLVLEVFLVSFGAFALLAAGLGIAGIVLAFAESSLFGWTLLGVAVVADPLVVWGAFRLLRHLPFARGFYLDPPQLTEEQRRAAAAPLKELVGVEGEALSPLRPAGTARFGDRILEVVTDGTMVPRAARVKVVEVSGNRVVVRPVS
ncbi:MAG: NfeD family protein [Planctomycetota bacterium]